MAKLEDLLKEYCASDHYPFHMPGHKRRGDPLYALDITEIDGFDNLHHPEEILKEEQELAAGIYGVKETFFSVNGSTCGNLAAISAAVPKGGTLLTERGAHISVYHAAYLRDLKLIFIDHPGTKIRDCVEAEGLEAGFPSFDAVMLVSPSYEGCVRDIEAWARFAHKRNVPLIVDEAHGAHFSVNPYFPESATRQGADIVIQSTHKTLPAMTQTALVHNVTGRVKGSLIRRFMDIYETSSPSYVLMSSISSSMHLIKEHPEAFEDYASRLGVLRKRLAGLKNLSLAGGEEGVIQYDGEIPGKKAGTKMDPGKIVILTRGCREKAGGREFDGPALYHRLRTDFHIQLEMKAPGYILAMTSVCDTDEGFGRLAHALSAIDAELYTESDEKGAEIHNKNEENVEKPPAAAPVSEFEVENALGISEAMDAPSELIGLREAAGRVSADFICVYPPDSPVIIPGEVFTEDVIKNIQEFLAEGLEVTGTAGGKVAVVALYF